MHVYKNLKSIGMIHQWLLIQKILLIWYLQYDRFEIFVLNLIRLIKCEKIYIH